MLNDPNLDATLRLLWYYLETGIAIIAFATVLINLALIGARMIRTSWRRLIDLDEQPRGIKSIELEVERHEDAV